MARASDSSVESTSQSLKNQVELTTHSWCLWVVLALDLRSDCVCMLVVFIFGYVLIANWILGKEFFIWWRTMQVKFLNFTLFGTYFRLDVLHSLIPFKWYQSLYLHFTHAKMSITYVVIEYWIGCDGFMVIKYVAIYKCCTYVYKCCECWQSLWTCLMIDYKCCNWTLC